MKQIAFAALLCVAAVPAGCSSKVERPKTYAVTGAVTMNNRPVEGARVVFVPTSNIEAASGITDADGKYALSTFEAGDGAMPGEFRVKVAKYDTSKGATAPDEQKQITYEEEQKLQFASDERPAIPAKNTLPKKYHSETSSGLTHKVSESPSTFDIKIE